jgi:hypothetical protein
LSSNESQLIPPTKALSWKDFKHELEITGDGSPTLRSERGQGESMHHSGGAFSETLQIYGSVLKEAFERVKKVGVLSVGLGLGYNELLVSALDLSHPGSDVRLRSFETDPFLTQHFVDFLNDQLPEGEIKENYEIITDLWAKNFNLQSENIRKNLLYLMNEKKFRLEGDYSKVDQHEKMNVILYDAYSSKTSQELWSEEFLKSSLADWAAEDCILATYACTGPLKRALLANQFQFVKKDGFFGKRNSTQGRRGVFKN